MIFYEMAISFDVGLVALGISFMIIDYFLARLVMCGLLIFIVCGIWYLVSG